MSCSMAFVLGLTFVVHVVSFRSVVVAATAVVLNLLCGHGLRVAGTGVPARRR